MHASVCGGVFSTCICVHENIAVVSLSDCLLVAAYIHYRRSYSISHRIASVRLCSVRFAEFEFKWHLVFCL